MKKMKLNNKRLGLMISSVFLFIATLWWTIGSLLMPDPESLLFNIVWSFICIGLIFGTGFVIITFFIPSKWEDEKNEVKNGVCK